MDLTEADDRSSGTETRQISVADALTLAIGLHQRNLLDEAEQIYEDVLRTVPDQPDALHFLGVLAHQRGDTELALTRLQKALEFIPEQADLLNNLGNVYREAGRLEEAITTWSAVLDIAPDHADTWVNLAVVQSGLGRLDDALMHLEKAILLQPEHIKAHHNLGNVLRGLGRFEEALEAYQKSADLSPDHQGIPKAIAKLLYDTGRHADAILTLERWLAKHPDDAIAWHLLAAYSGRNVPARASDQMIRQTFNSFANSFDEVLMRLDYKAPQLIARLVAELIVDGLPHRVLDAGCGTGLVGALLKPMAESISGVDLSAAMLEKARRRQIYDELHEAELTDFMIGHPNAFDIVVCADTLVYFGDLTEACRALFTTLRPGGWVFFTLEQSGAADAADAADAAEFSLMAHGRYSHTRTYIEDSLRSAGLGVKHLESVILRLELREPVSGLLIAAQRQA